MCKCQKGCTVHVDMLKSFNSIFARDVFLRISDTLQVEKIEQKIICRDSERRRWGRKGTSRKNRKCVREGWRVCLVCNLRSAAMSTTRNNTIHYPASGWVDRELLTPPPAERDHKLCVFSNGRSSPLLSNGQPSVNSACVYVQYAKMVGCMCAFVLLV